MGRPKNKQELLTLSKQNFDKLFDYIESLKEDEQQTEFPAGTLNRNIKDVLMHLHHWHLLMMEWYKTGMAGSKPAMPAKGYTWKTMPEFNKWIWDQYKQESLDKAKQNFKTSFKQVRALIESHSDEELFEKKRYNWTGTTSLGAYLVSATSSHYEWALNLIKKAKSNKLIPHKA